MKKYPILQPNQDFILYDLSSDIKGTRPKRKAIILKGRPFSKHLPLAYFKYEHPEYIQTANVSEKLSYEIAKILKYKCARIEFACDFQGEIGILNYSFLKLTKGEIHIDIVSFLKKADEDRKDFLTLSNIENTLNHLQKGLFDSFLKIIVFDSLVGEVDRHEENWGLTKVNDKYKMSPLYDNGTGLLCDFKKIEFAQSYYLDDKKFESYIKKSKSYIYSEDKKKRYTHFDLIDEIIKRYPGKIEKELKNLKRLTDKKIIKIVSKIPDDFLTDKHRQYIIYYLQRRRNILLQKLRG